MDNSLNQSTYEQLKKDILTFALKPGDTVSAAKVANRYNVSRTPAREALVKLETEGLVDIIPQSKSVISRINLNKAKQEWFIRQSLEMAMVGRVINHIQPEDIKEMKKYNKQMTKLMKHNPDITTSYEYQCADNAFHAVTFRTAGEEMALSVISNNNANYSRLRFLTELEDSYQGRTVAGHDELISLLEKKDKEGYAKALSLHLGHIINDISYLERKYPNYFIEE